MINDIHLKLHGSGSGLYMAGDREPKPPRPKKVRRTRRNKS